MDRQARKTALRLFSYGLYAVTSRELETRNAFTANWLSQASFEPPIVMVSVERDSVSLGMIRRTGRFGVSVLPAGARELAGRLGHSLAKRPDKLAGLVLDDSPGGLPVLADAAGWLECRLVGEIAAGDSSLLLGEVVDAGVHSDVPALTMREAGFRHAG